MLRFVIVLLFAIGSAEAAYITDKLLVGFYAKPDTSIQPTKVLPSSTPMEVLGKKNAFSKVRLGDGKEGWVKTIYISNEKPARAMLLELQAKSSTIQNKLRQTEKALKAAKAGKAAPATNSANLAKLQQVISQYKQKLTATNNALKSEQKTSKRLTALLKKSSSKGAGSQSKQVKALKKKLSTSEAELRATLHEARLLQELLKKTDQTASQRIATLETEVLKAKKSQAASSSSNASNSALAQQNAIMKKRLQQLSKILGQPLPAVATQAATEPETEAEIPDEADDDSGYGFGTWAFLLILLLIGGFVGGIAFKNHHIRRRYGGFRI